MRSVIIRDKSGEILIKVIDRNGEYEVIKHSQVTSDIEIRDDKNCKVLLHEWK